MWRRDTEYTYKVRKVVYQLYSKFGAMVQVDSSTEYWAFKVDAVQG